TPILTGLIEASALPFKAIETQFGVDSSGFSACKFDRWYNEKHGHVESEHAWVKVHAMTGTTTHIVAAVIIDHKDSPDCPQFPKLAKATARAFTVRQFTGDKAYSSAENHDVAEQLGADPYFAFKSNASGKCGKVYERMYHLFCLKKEEFFQHYHRRSNVASTFSAAKRLFGDSVRSRTDVAMSNEVLAKLLAYNITCL